MKFLSLKGKGSGDCIKDGLGRNRPLPQDFYRRAGHVHDGGTGAPIYRAGVKDEICFRDNGWGKLIRAGTAGMSG